MYRLPYRDNPPGPSCNSAVQELCRLSQSSPLEVINPLKDWKWTNLDLVSSMNELAILSSRLSSVACTSCTQFPQHVSNVLIRT